MIGIIAKVSTVDHGMLLGPLNNVVLHNLVGLDVNRIFLRIQSIILLCSQKFWIVLHPNLTYLLSTLSDEKVVKRSSCSVNLRSVEPHKLQCEILQILKALRGQ